MSAFICSDTHIQTIAKNYANLFECDNLVIDIANELKKENIKSVNFRYDESNKCCRIKNIDDVKNVSYIELFKLVQCLDYQSCEHKTWKKSKAYLILNSLSVMLTKLLNMDYDSIHSSEQYHHADWSI